MDSLVVFAESDDRNISAQAGHHNAHLWDRVDVFEIVVRHTRRPEYRVFHVVPNGLTPDLRYP